MGRGRFIGIGRGGGKGRGAPHPGMRRPANGVSTWADVGLLLLAALLAVALLVTFLLAFLVALLLALLAVLLLALLLALFFLFALLVALTNGGLGTEAEGKHGGEGHKHHFLHCGRDIWPLGVVPARPGD